ncbi:hypothetical protein [Streptomyces qinzhouensis]|nr:hypothetical protein [Streptomyces qinzhouensis]
MSRALCPDEREPHREPGARSGGAVTTVPTTPAHHPRTPHTKENA